MATEAVVGLLVTDISHALSGRAQNTEETALDTLQRAPKATKIAPDTHQCAPMGGHS